MLVDGYVRVSQVAGRGGETFISPAVQRTQIESWAELAGATIGEIFEELDESGARADRPMLMEALTRVERGDSEGIVVAKLDRFGRSLVDGLANIERLSAAGAIFVSVQDGLDLSTPTGKLIVRIMLSMAEWELDRIRENWSVARARAVARGVHPTVAPFGYRRGRGGRLVPDGAAAAMVTELFRRRAESATLRSLLELLDASGLETGRGHAFVEGTLRGVLANRTYLGEAWSGPHLNPAAHPPLVDALAAPRRAEGLAVLHDPAIEERWPGLSTSERRSLIEEHLDCVFIAAGPGPVIGRARVCRRGQAPADLPRRGSPLGEVRPFDPRECPSRPLRRPVRWSPRRIEAELRSWWGEAEQWPTYVEFLTQGRARLHHQVLGYGGVCYWARRLGWSLPPRTTSWDEETIRGGLRPILAGGRKVWPSKREFEAIGLGGLRRAVIMQGGIEHWAGALGLESRPGTSRNRISIA